MNIVGRLTENAQVQTLSNGKQVVNFSVAVNDNYRNKAGENVQQTSFFDCAYWLSTGVAPYLTKGTLVELEGRVSARAWLNREGEPQAGLNFHTSKIKFQVTAGQVAEEDEDDLPF